ncbi:MAG TPA: hypothetical protein VF885_09930, partial [Arthrobacter sp.]
GPRRQDRVQPRPVHHTACGDQRKSDGGPHPADQLRRRARPGGAVTGGIVPVGVWLERRGGADAEPDPVRLFRELVLSEGPALLAGFVRGRAGT